MQQPLVPFIATVLAPAALGVFAIVFGESDDAPGLVMFGLLLIAGAIAFAFKPELRSKGRFILGFILGAIALTAVGAVTAGWLENTF